VVFIVLVQLHQELMAARFKATECVGPFEFAAISLKPLRDAAILSPASHLADWNGDRKKKQQWHGTYQEYC